MAELPRRSRRLRGKSPEIVTGTDLLRKLRRQRSESLDEDPSLYETVEVPVSPRGSRVGPLEAGDLPEEGTSSLVVHPDYRGLETGYNPELIAVSEIAGSFSSASDIGEEPNVSEPVTPTSSAPDSPKVERVITDDLPSGMNRKLQIVQLEVTTVYLVASFADPVMDSTLTFQGIDP